jgi:hypothetical protein
MIFAELHGKLGVDYSRAHERAEDLFTSTVFGLLRYLPPGEGLLAVLGVVRPFPKDSPRLTVSDRATRCEIQFWPNFGNYGQPDLLLTVSDASNEPLLVVLIEAKLYAPKSGRADDDDPSEEDRPDPDQLVKYWQGLHILGYQRERVRVYVVYLTAHSVPPVEELDESLRHRPDMALGWISWTDIWEIVTPLASSHLPAYDLADLLAHKGFKRFTGFVAERWRPLESARFWYEEDPSRKGWFHDEPVWQQPPTRVHFFQCPERRLSDE